MSDIFPSCVTCNITPGRIFIEGTLTDETQIDWLISLLQASRAVVFPKTAKFNVVMMSHGDRKIEVIKEIRTLTSWDLKQAKDASEMVGAIIGSDLSHIIALEWQKSLRRVGADVAVVVHAGERAYRESVTGIVP